MSQIAHDFYASNPLLFMPLVALVMFIGAFVTILLRAYFSSDATLSNASSMPLDSSETPHE